MSKRTVEDYDIKFSLFVTCNLFSQVDEQKDAQLENRGKSIQLTTIPMYSITCWVVENPLTPPCIGVANNLENDDTLKYNEFISQNVLNYRSWIYHSIEKWVLIYSPVVLR